MNFLPTNYSAPSSNQGTYFKVTENKQKIRIVSSAIVWRLDRDHSGDRPKPIRTIEKKPKLGDNEPKHFWACIVYNYDTKSLQIREITQKTIQNQLSTYIQWDWGNPQNYDLIIWKTGQKMETEYYLTTTPDWIKEPPVEVTQAWVDSKIYLEALFTGDDPFAGEPKTIDLSEDIKF